MQKQWKHLNIGQDIEQDSYSMEMSRFAPMVFVKGTSYEKFGLGIDR